MYTLIIRKRLSTFVSSTTAIAIFSAASALSLQAQQSAGTAASLPTTTFKMVVAAPLNLSLPDDLSYSSSVGAAETATAENFIVGDSEENQPPPRRRYGRRPVYNDSMHNADGSNKWTFEAGAGLTIPVGDSHSYLTPSWKIQVGGGRNFNKTFGVLLQFDYDNFGFQGSTLQTQQNILNLYTDATGLDGHSHIWSFTLNPIVNYYTSDTFGAYAIGGVGFYHKTADFTVPAIGTYCDPYYGCYQYQANTSIDKYTSNSAGVNAGLGFTYKMSRFASSKLFTEVRYVYTFNDPRTFQAFTAANPNYNFFPQNSHKTGYLPVTFGIRW